MMATMSSGLMMDGRVVLHNYALLAPGTYIRRLYVEC
jgi:hypothetical protein